MNVMERFMSGLRGRAIPAPVLDGPFSPNQRLDLCTLVDRQLPGADDVVVTSRGRIVSQGNRLVRVSGMAPYSLRAVVAELEGPVGGICAAPRDGLLVCVSGVGVIGLGGEHSGLRITSADGTPIRCPTAATVITDGRIVITEGSLRNGVDGWDVDWAELGDTGRVICYDPRTRVSKTIASGLKFPWGVAQRSEDDALIVTEAWSGSLLVLHRVRDGWSAPKVGVTHLPGYPSRIVSSERGGFWVGFASIRTQMLDFVRQQPRLLKRMRDEVPREFWMSPALKTSDHPLEPLQLGGIKVGGVSTAWAPGRSYGLVARINNDLEVVESLHSRSDGKRHGVTGLCEYAGELFIVSKGDGKLLVLEDESDGR